MNERRGDRAALVAVGAQFFVNGAVLASFVPRLPEIREALDLDLDGIGALLAAGGACGLVASLTVSRVVERTGTRAAMTVGGVVLAGALAVIGVASSPLTLLLGLGAFAVADIVVDTTMNLQVSWLSARRAVPVVNRAHGLWSLGTVVAGFAASRVAAAGWSVRSHLLAVAVLAAIAVLAISTRSLRDDVDDPADDGGGSTTGGAARPPRSLASFAVVGAGALAVEITASDWAAFRLRDDLGTSAGVAGLGFVAFTAGMTVSRLLGDFVQHRIGASRLLRLAATVAAAGVVAAAVIPTTAGALAGSFVTGLGVAPLFPRLYDDAARRRGRPGAGIGALTAGSRVASLVAPAAVGAVAATDASVGTAMALVALPALAVVAALDRDRTVVRRGA